MVSLMALPAGASEYLSPHDWETGVCGMVQRAETATGEGRHGDAVIALEAALRFEPDNADLNFLLARALMRAGRYREAEDLLVETRSVHPEDPQGWFLSGVLMARWGRHEKARHLLHAAHRLAPDDPYLRLNLGTLLLGGGDHRRAAAMLDGGDWPLPQAWQAVRWNNLGVAWLMLGRRGDAAVAFRRALDALPPDGPWDRDTETPAHLRQRLEDHLSIARSRLGTVGVTPLLLWPLGPGPGGCP